MVTARDKIQAYQSRPCFFVEPLSFALALNKRDPITGMPGVPLGTIWELAGGNGRGKTLSVEHHLKHLFRKSKKKVLWLGFERVDIERLLGLESQGIDLDRLEILDYSNAQEGFELEYAEQALNTARSMCETGDYEEMVIDSLGGMPVKKEVFDDKGNFFDVDKTPQVAIRATIVTRFINQWQMIDPNSRPILTVVNHMKDVIDAGGFGIDPLKVVRIGENLNYNTPGGNGIKYAYDVRVKLDAKKVELRDSVGKPIKHPIFDSNIQTGLEIHYELYKNKFCPDQGTRRAIGKFDFESKSFDLEEEIISYCDYLDIGGIYKAGAYIVGVNPNKKLHAKEAKAYLRERPEFCQDLIVQIAARSNELFALKKKEKGEDKSL